MPCLITSHQMKYNENKVYHFKKKYNIQECKKSVVKIFADTRYKLYINGMLVAVGPCRASSEIKYYDELDVTEYIQLGENVFDVTVLQLANEPYLDEYMFMESIIRTGSMCLGIWGNIGNVDVETDESWLVSKETGLEFFYKPEYKAYNVAALCEKISPYYKKDVFYNAVSVRGLYDMEDEDNSSTELINPVKKRTIPMMFFKEKKVEKIKEGLYDAGELTCGYIKIRFTGTGKVRLTYAECMVFKENEQIIKRKRDDINGVIIGDYDLIDVCGECVFEPFWMRTFRYIKIDVEGDVRVEKVNFLETGYPIEICNEYDFGNYRDNKLFGISVNTLKRCMHETYVDCPYYEQLQYTMDTHLQILYSYQLSMDKRLAEKAIDDFAKSYRAGGLTQSRYPVNKAQYIPGFSLFYILMLYEHSNRFNDVEFIKKYIPIADGIVDWFVKRLDGYMVKRSNLWDFIDWSDEYDKETGTILSRAPITVYSLMFAYVLEKLSSIYNLLKINNENYLSLSCKIKEDVKSRCFDEKKGLYSDTPEKSHFSQHSQIWAVLCELEKGDNAKVLLSKAMKLECKATYAYMFYMLRALEKADLYELANEYIEPLRNLIDLGCTTTPECMRDDVRSECHAWSAIAIYEFTAKVLGVKYTDNCINIKPYVKGRSRAKGVVATPKGMVFIEWNIVDDIFNVIIDVPATTDTVITMPDNSIIHGGSGRYSCNIK